VNSGHWLFRWRSYLPLVVLALLFMDFDRFALALQNELWVILCLVVSLFGLGIRVYTMGHVPQNTSGRNTKTQLADSLNTTGIYSLVRNPLYLGNFWIWFGVSLYAQQWWTPLITALIFALYHERIIMTEESFLEEKFGDRFRSWAAKTPAFIPRFGNWVPPEETFCWRTALHREYRALFAIVAIFSCLEAIGHYVAYGKLHLDFRWTCIFAVALFIFVAVRVLHKTTRLLQVTGR